MTDTFNTPKESIFYEDEKLYCALAYSPLTHGHVVVVWKDDVPDLSRLNESNYDYLMDIVDATRDAMKTFYDVEKVYLLYMDEANHVHWHLVPRYEEMGFTNLCHKPESLSDFSEAKALEQLMK